MTAYDQPNVEVVHRLLAKLRTRLTWISATLGAAAGLAVTTAILLVLTVAHVELSPTPLISTLSGIVAAVIGAGVAVAIGTPRRRHADRTLEARVPQFRNTLITATELSQRSIRASGKIGSANALHPSQSSPVAFSGPEYIAEAVYRDAARAAAGVDLRVLFPGTRAAVALAASVSLFGIVASRDTAPIQRLTRVAQSVVGLRTLAIDDVEITVASPAYMQRKQDVFRNVTRIDVRSGSRVTLRVRSNGDTLLVQTAQRATSIAVGANGLATLDIPVATDGFIALTVSERTGRIGERRLIGVTAIPDAPPTVRIVAPGRDVMLRDAHHTIDLAINADDDIGLASLRLRYTKVSGSGERFTFTEGEVPLALSRTSSREWSARARWIIDSLALTPGDMVVYRAVVSDARPGAAPQESDAYIAELTAPGSDAVAGFSIDPDQERYAVSQQMVIVKTERLIARRASLSADSASIAAQELAAEQRKVRAEFVFMMGGELADAPDPTGNMNDLNEEAEAEGEADIAAGRLANQGRMALMRAIRFMSRAATLLTNAELGDALAAEQGALKQLEQAFSRTRILLRALSEREQLDMKRRMTASLTDARSTTRAATLPPVDQQQVTLGQLLADLGSIDLTARRSPAPENHTRDIANKLSVLAQAALRVNASSPQLQRVAEHLSGASTATLRNETLRAQQQRDSATIRLSVILRSNVPTTADVIPSTSSRLLSGVLSDALRRVETAIPRPSAVRALSVPGTSPSAGPTRATTPR